MEWSSHAIKRYCERVLKLDKEEARKRVHEDREELVAQLNTLYSRSAFVWKGNINENLNHFYITDDLIFCMDENDECVVTLYKADFGFGPKANEYLIEEIMSKIGELRAEYRDLNEENASFIEKHKCRIEQIDNAIFDLQEKINLLLQEKKGEETAIENCKTRLALITNDIAQQAKLLCNTLQYKMDISLRTKK